MHEQKKLLARRLSSNYQHIYGMITSEGEVEFIRYFYPLLFRVYELHLEGKHLSLTIAYQYTTLAHGKTRKKYMEAAIAAGYFETMPSPRDGRKILLKPTEKLLRFVEKEIEREMEDIQNILEACK